MPGPDHEKNSPYSFLNRLSTKTLKQILQDDFESDDPGTLENDEFITRVMEVMAQREAETSKFPKFDVDAGWRDFQQNYQPREGDVVPVCGDPVPGGLIENNGHARQAGLKPRRPGRVAKRVLRAAVIAAIVASLCAAAASALEVNIFKMVAQWTQDIFQFHSETNISQNTVYESGVFLEDSQTLKGLLAEENITQPVCPTWVPAGYAFCGADTVFNADTRMFISVYESEIEENPIVVTVVAHKEPQGLIAEKDDMDVTAYVKDGIEHYIMTNVGVLVSSWFIDNLECFISGNISESEMKAMIDSIYEE